MDENLNLTAPKGSDKQIKKERKKESQDLHAFVHAGSETLLI